MRFAFRRRRRRLIIVLVLIGDQARAGEGTDDGADDIADDGHDRAERAAGEPRRLGLCCR